MVLPLVSDFLDNVREDERRRMAAELHDSTVQHLTAVNLNIINLRRELAQGKNTEKLIGVIEESGEAAQDEIRLFSYLTFPCQLEAEGFKSTIEHYLVGFARRSHLNIAFHIPSRVDTVPVALQHALLRITQEGLSNVHRHASAHRVTVTLAMEDQKLSLKIDDDGHGILPTNTDKRIDRGVGMQSMTARLREFDGSLRLMSSSKGTSLIAEVPLRSALRHQLDVSHRFVGSLPKRPVNWEIKTGTTSRGRCNKPRALQSLTT